MLERLTLDQYEFHILRISNEWFEEKKIRNPLLFTGTLDFVLNIKI